MAGRIPGRPKKSEGDRGTKHVRLNEDLAEMIGWITRCEGGTSATLCDPLLRPQIEARYAHYSDMIARLKRADAERQAAEEAAAAAYAARLKREDAARLSGGAAKPPASGPASGKKPKK